MTLMTEAPREVIVRIRLVCSHPHPDMPWKRCDKLLGILEEAPLAGQVVKLWCDRCNKETEFR